MLSCEFCKIQKNTFFAEYHQTTASDNSSINSISNEGRIGKQICELWYKIHASVWATSVTYWGVHSSWNNRFQKQSFADFSF